MKRLILMFFSTVVISLACAQEKRPENFEPYIFKYSTAQLKNSQGSM